MRGMASLTLFIALPGLAVGVNGYLQVLTFAVFMVTSIPQYAARCFFPAAVISGAVCFVAYIITDKFNIKLMWVLFSSTNGLFFGNLMGSNVALDLRKNGGTDPGSRLYSMPYRPHILSG